MGGRDPNHCLLRSADTGPSFGQRDRVARLHQETGRANLTLRNVDLFEMAGSIHKQPRVLMSGDH